jgi:signal transduction histidine kinase
MFANQSALRILGYGKRQLVGQSIHRFLACGDALESGDAGQTDACPICQSLADGKARCTQSALLSSRSGSHVAVTYRVTPLESGGRVVGAVFGFDDLTQSDRIRAGFLQARKLEGIGRLAAGVAHEINTPTQYVNDNVHFLRDAYEILSGFIRDTVRIADLAAAGESVDKDLAALNRKLAAADLEGLNAELGLAIEQTLEGLDRITTIVGALNEFLHPGADERISVDLNHAIRNAVAVCRNEWRYVADVELNLCHDLPAVSCYLGELSQVIVNIVTNAAHAVAEKSTLVPGTKGKISVSTDHDSEWVAVCVSDTGIGMGPEVRERIFDSFYTTKEVGKGTGQGLAIAHAVVVDKHQGTIDVVSEPGKGSTFTIRLPRVDQMNAAENQPESRVQGEQVR